MTTRKKRRRKSSKRVARGKKLARTLPRDEKGKFLPRGSKNRFRKKKRRRSVPPKRRSRKKQIKRAKLTRRRSQPAMSRRGMKSKDNFPNFMSGELFQTVNNSFVTKTINTPIPRLKTIGNRATVMELLYFDLRLDGITFDIEDADVHFQMTLGTVQTAILGWADTRVIMDFKFGVTNLPLLVSASSVIISPGMPWRYQFQTMDGFGYLLASDTFRVSMTTNDMPVGLAVANWKLFYRFVDIPLAEFIGIVQSTQAQ